MTEHDHGRVDDDGTVFVRRPDGQEVVVGQWAAGDPAEGLTFFERKYEGLKAEADLLLIRLREGKGSSDNLACAVFHVIPLVIRIRMGCHRENARCR